MLICRDPFAREELHRAAIHKTELPRGASCQGCGNLNGRGGLYRYRVEPDSISGRSYPDQHLFCSVACRRTYYE